MNRVFSTLSRGVLGLLLVGVLGCGDTFNEGGAKPQGAQGVKILDLKEGTGDALKEGDRVEVHYRGWVKASERKFDDSYEKGQTMVVEIGGGEVIPGFDEGLQGMKSRGERRIFIPSRLGYGPQGAGRDIPPNADLVFQVEVVKVLGRGSEVKITDLKEGIGDPIKKGDRVAVHYTGTLENGTKFDSSLDRQPLEPFPLTVGAGRVIKGWDIGLIGAKTGGKRKLEIPAHLGYGKSGSPPKIPPDSNLIFEIDIVSVRPGIPGH